MQRLFRFIFKHLFINIRFLFVYAYLFLQKEARVNINIFDFRELAEEIKSGKSIIRFGDGEIYIINYGSIHYENYNKKLRRIYLKSISDYHKNKDKYILGLNNWALAQSNSNLKVTDTFFCWLPYKASIKINFDLKEKYFDASLFYQKRVFEDYVLPHIINKKVILISRKTNYEHLKEKNFFKDLYWVETPDFHSFTKYDEIKENINQKILYLQNSLGDVEKNKDIVLLVACGPASKAICYEYSLQGIQSLDIGRGIELVGTNKDLEWMLK